MAKIRIEEFSKESSDGIHLVCRFFSLDDDPKKLLYPLRKEEEQF